MGHVEHDAVLVSTSDYRPKIDIDAFRASLPEELRPLVIGPIKAATNGYVHYVWLPDGSKSGWDLSDEADEHRDRFLALFDFQHEDGSSPDDVVEIRYGEDYAHDHGATMRWRRGALHGGEIL